MSQNTKRATIYFEPALHRALRIKAVHTHSTVSEIVNEAVRLTLREDQEDLAAFDERANESTMSYKKLRKDLRLHGKI